MISAQPHFRFGILILSSIFEFWYWCLIDGGSGEVYPAAPPLCVLRGYAGASDAELIKLTANLQVRVGRVVLKSV